MLFGDLELQSVLITEYDDGMAITYLLILHEDVFKKIWAKFLLGCSQTDNTSELHVARRRRRTSMDAVEQLIGRRRLMSLMKNIDQQQCSR